jgi:hypothetical protein
MSSLHGFSDTEPSSLSGINEVHCAEQLANPEFVLAGVISTLLSPPLATLQQLLDQFANIPAIQAWQLDAFGEAIDATYAIVAQSRQISVLASGHLRQAHEDLKLDHLLREALLQHGAALNRRGVTLHHSIKPVEVIADASLLAGLLTATLDWALNTGAYLIVTLRMKNWPEHGLLSVKVGDLTKPPQTSTGKTDGDSLDWYVLSETAWAMGVSVERIISKDEVTLMIEFPRTVKRLEGMTAVEVETGGSSMDGDARPLAGHRVLVISSDQQLCSDIKIIARSMSLVVDFVQTTSQALRFCELDMPHLVIIDQHAHDHVFIELRRQLQLADPHFPLIEVAKDSNTLEIAGWMSDSMSRLSRDCLRAQLPGVLVQELAKGM